MQTLVGGDSGEKTSNERHEFGSQIDCLSPVKASKQALRLIGMRPLSFPAAGAPMQTHSYLEAFALSWPLVLNSNSSLIQYGPVHLSY